MSALLKPSPLQLPRFSHVTPAAAADRAERDAEADAARGPPPEPCRAFRVPKECVGELLMVWEFTQVRGDESWVGWG